MPATEIVPRAFFALRSDVKQNAHYISDFQILYPAGSVLILHNYYEKRQRYINLQEKSVFLEMIAMSSSRKLAAVIQNGEKGQIVVFDMQTLKKKRTLNLPPDSQTNRFDTITFTHDDMYIVALTGEPDWNLVLYNWEKGKVTGISKAITTTNPVTIVQICCSPTDNSEVCLVGQGLFRLLNRVETVWRQYGFQKAEQINITSAAWLASNRIVCGTMDGKIFFVDNGDLKAIYNAFAVNSISLKEKEDLTVGGSSSLLLVKTQSESQENEDIAVRALTAFAKGFAYSCRSGFVHLFEKESANKFRKRNVFRIADSDLLHMPQLELNIVKHLSINVSQDKLLATTNRAQLYTVRLWGPDINVAPEIPFKHLGESLHHGKINGLTTCVWKPFFATSGLVDRTVRIWNYETETVQIVKHYAEEVYCISLHPTGNFIAIGFADRVDLAVVLMNDIQTYRKLPVQSCSVCQFSLYGQYIAAVDNNVIEIFGTVLLNSVLSLKGHQSRVNAVQWITDDKKLASCTQEGEIFLWDTVSGTLIGEIRTPEIRYQDIAVSCDGVNIFALDSEGTLHKYINNNLSVSVKFRLSTSDKILLSRSNLMLFLAGDIVLSVKVPLTNPPEYSEFFYHSGRVTQLKLSYDDQNLVSVSSKGTVIIWKLNVSEGKTVAPIDKNFIRSTEILINKSELEKKILTIRDLSQKLYELEIGQAKEMSDTENYYCDSIKEIHDTYEQTIQELKDKIEEADADQNKQLLEIKKELEDLMKEQEKEKRELVESYERKLLVEYEKVRALDALKDEAIKEFEKTVAELEKSKEEETNELIRVYEQKLADVNKLLQETYEKNKENILEHEKTKQQLEEDTDREIVETKAKYEGSLREEKEENVVLKDETIAMRKRYAEAHKERDEFRARLEGLQAELSKRQSTIQSLEKDVADLKAEIIERDAAAEEKDEKIFLLKKQIQELDKFKFVLEYKIKELKKEIDPKDREIREKKEQIADMEVELENLKKICSSLELQLIELKEKIHGTEREIGSYEMKYRSGVNAMRQIRIDIYSLYQELNDYKKLKDGIMTLNHKYHACGIDNRQEYGESDVQKELLVQREFLEKTIAALRSTLEKGQGTKQDKTKVVRDNVVLLEELNSIRKKLTESTKIIQSLRKLVGIKRNKSMVPSEAFNRLQQALKNHADLRHTYQAVIEDADKETEDLKSKAEKMQEKFVALMKVENK